MNMFRGIVASGIVAWMFLSAAVAEDVKPPQGFRALFNGKDLSGWHGMGHFEPAKLAAMSEQERNAKRAADQEDLKKHWRVENNELINDGEGVYMTTDEELGNIELLIDYKTVPLADSGIYLRGAPQVQIWDYTPAGGKLDLGAGKGSGGLWNNSPGAPGKDPLVLADKPFGEWNHFRIIQIGERTTVYLNDKLVVDNARMENFWDRSAPLPAKGVIQLQTHGGEIRWRNIFVREIPADEANKFLAGRGCEGFSPVFNGTNLDGWAGDADNYEVRDGAIVCKPGKGGTLYTKEKYADFVARVEFLLPPGGNNGLAIRYPGHGNPAYDGMTELQVLDNTAEMYAGKLDPRQYHGSVYGMIPAKTGYLNKVGEWNFEEVTVKGSTIKVELNGTVILDGDVSQVKEFMANSAHPGKDFKEGFFGFAGHNDPVQFRNIQIKKLQ
jgi:hypothetical protein